jgi:isoquinoline 1-oxidoreductase alpha subunit
MTAIKLLASNRKPTDADIDAAMDGSICRCGAYIRIRKAIHQAARALA